VAGAAAFGERPRVECDCRAAGFLVIAGGVCAGADLVDGGVAGDATAMGDDLVAGLRPVGGEHA